MFPQYSQAAQQRRCACSSRRYRCQPVVENRQRGPPAERILLVLGLRVQDDDDGAVVIVGDPGEPDGSFATSGKWLSEE